MLGQFYLAIGILLLAGAAGLLNNAFRTDPLPLVQDWGERSGDLARTRLPTGLSVIDIKDMKRAYRDKGVLVLDARPRDFYMMEHIPGAVSFPLEAAEKNMSELVKGLPPDINIITYCDGPSCPSARKLGAMLLRAGRGNVRVFLGGMEDWVTHGLPVDAEAGS